MATLVQRLPTFSRSGYQIVALGTVHINKRNNSSKLTAYKRGTGGRSSFSGQVVTLFGASGFLGRYVANKLGKVGAQIIIPYAGDPYWVQRLKLVGDLGQVNFMPIHLKDEESLRKAMQYSNAVVNLISRDFETRNFTFDAVNNVGARDIARIARECGVERLVHFSALNASPEPPHIYLKGGSKWLKSKYDGELSVREEFPDAVIFRPSDIFGEEDRFVRYYGSWWRRFRGKMPMYKKGMQTVKQPVYVSDVAQGVVNALKSPDSAGQTYDVVGPHRYYLGDLIDYFYSCMRWSSIKKPFFHPLMWAKVYWMSNAPSTPFYTKERIEREFITDELTEDQPTLLDLGMTDLQNIEPMAHFTLKLYRKHRSYQDALGEFPDPIKPPIVSSLV